MVLYRKRCLIELPILYFVPVHTCTLISLVPYRYRCLCMYRTTGYLLIVIESVYIFIFLYSQVWAFGSGSMVQIQTDMDPDPQHICTVPVPTVLLISWRQWKKIGTVRCFENVKHTKTCINVCWYLPGYLPMYLFRYHLLDSTKCEAYCNLNPYNKPLNLTQLFDIILVTYGNRW